MDQLERFITKSGRLNPRAQPNDWLLEKQQLLGARSPQEALFLLWHGMERAPLCAFCGVKPATFKKFSAGYGRFCSNSCAFHGAQKHQKKIAALQQSRGVENVFQDKAVIEKIKKRLAPMRAEMAAKAAATVRRRHGVAHNLRLPAVLKAREAAREENWIKRVPAAFFSGGEYQTRELPRRSTAVITVKHAQCGLEFEASFSNGRFPVCPRCFNKSKSQEEISQWIEAKGFGVIRNDRKVIAPLELDIVVPAARLAIEYNGDYWHSEKFDDGTRLVKKIAACEAAEHRLLIIQESQWWRRREIVLSKILIMLGLAQKISARKCDMIELPRAAAVKFFEMEHLDGAPPASSITKTLALVHDNRIVSALSIGKSRWSKLASMEVVRFCTVRNTVVQGGLSRLSQAAGVNIVTYSSRAGGGDGWEAAGWTYVGETGPSYKWVSRHGERSRYECQRHRLQKLLGRPLKEGETEQTVMSALGYLKVFNAGNRIYKYEH